VTSGRRFLLAAMLAVAGAAGPAGAQEPVPADPIARPVIDTAPAHVRSVRQRAFVGGTLGSAIGLGGGLIAGYIAGERACRYPHSSEYFCGVGQVVFGMAAGSLAGAATGAYLGAHSAGHEPSIGATLAGAFLGLGAGMAAGAVLGFTDQAAIVVIGFTVAQGAVTGRFASRNLPAPREPEEAPPPPEDAPHH
jgi:hypothetical protein